MKEAEEKGAEAYITGEIHCHIDNDYADINTLSLWIM